MTDLDVVLCVLAVMLLMMGAFSVALLLDMRADDKECFLSVERPHGGFTVPSDCAETKLMCEKHGCRWTEKFSECLCLLPEQDYGAHAQTLPTCTTNDLNWTCEVVNWTLPEPSCEMKCISLMGPTAQTRCINDCLSGRKTMVMRGIFTIIVEDEGGQ